jgi:hypothetical protein
MEKRDAVEIKERILKFLRIRGPSIPVYIAKDINQSILFTSAFLSELLSEKKVKQSYLRVGSSPVFFLTEQEAGLENFAKYLRSKEKDAFEILKEKKFLIEEEQDPAIRVALRSIKDFAVPFQREEKIIWRYFTIPEGEFKKEEKIMEKEILSVPAIESARMEEKEDKLEEVKKEKETSAITKIKKSKKKKITKKKSSGKKDDKFFERVKEFLSGKNIEILGIESFNKDDLVLRIKDGGEKLLVAYNRKRITEEDILRTYKRLKDFNMKYKILNLGPVPKKLSEFIESVKNLEDIDRIE